MKEVSWNSCEKSEDDVEDLDFEQVFAMMSSY